MSAPMHPHASTEAGEQLPLIADVHTDIAPVLLKTCSKCGATKPLEGFCRDRHTTSGYYPSCKECAGSKARAFYYRTREARLAQKAELRKDPAWRKAQRVKDKVYRHRNPFKVNARRKMVHAVRTGKLTRMPCEKCGDPRSHGHHHDYNKPLDVHWLCYSCHGKEHRTSPEGLAALEAGR